MKLNDVLLFLKVLALISSIRLGLYLFPYATLKKLLIKFSYSSFPRNLITRNRIDLGKLVWAINKSCSYMPGTTKCLARALTAEAYMIRQGYNPQLCIGVAKGKSGSLEAHAWIENCGKVVIGQMPNLERFKALPLPDERNILL